MRIRSKKTIIDNILFDSKIEAEYYLKLKALKKAKRIKSYIIKPKFKLLDSFTILTTSTKNGKSKKSEISYTPDFQYITNDNKIVIVEIKGYATEMYKFRVKLFLHNFQKGDYNIDEFQEIFKTKQISYCKNI